MDKSARVTITVDVQEGRFLHTPSGWQFAKRTARGFVPGPTPKRFARAAARSKGLK